MPKVKTTAEHKRDGTYNVTRHKKRVDTKFTPATPDVDSSHDAVAKKLRRQILASYPKGVLTSMDGATLNAACELYSQWVSMRGATESKEVNARCRIWAQFMEIAGKFGMTPADRAKLKVETGDDKEADPIQELMRQRLNDN